MCTTNDDIEETMARIENYMKGVAKLSMDIDAAIDISSMLTSDVDVVIGWACVGDYEPHLEEDRTIKWNYRPKVIRDGGFDKSLYQDDVDPSRIVSFTMPPLPKDYDGKSDPTHLVELEIHGEQP